MSVQHIEDSELLFFDKQKAIDPCHGLTEYGPYGIKEFRTIKVASIGSSSSLSDFNSFLAKLQNKISHKKPNYWPFPGLNKKSSLRFDIEVIAEKVIDDRDLSIFKEDSKINQPRLERIKQAISLFESKMKLIKDYDIEPDVVIFSIPEEILISCRDARFEHTDRIIIPDPQIHHVPSVEREVGHNFHHILKVIGMENGFPTQLIYPNSLKPDPSQYGKQDLSLIAWNFSVALLYKANELPWKYFEFPIDTCFVGISFHREYDDTDEPVIRASIAQTFLSDGDNIILKGKTFRWDIPKKSPHMSEEYSAKLFEEILKKYQEHWGHVPSRVVVQKSSEYWDEETNGINNALTEVPKVDLISIAGTDARFYRLGENTIVRGTYFNFYGRFYLYSVGYIPCLQLYPGSFIPEPLEIKFHQTSSTKKKICSEILALSRLDWNNIDYSTREPVTIRFSRSVGQILSESRALKMQKIPDKYRYYM